MQITDIYIEAIHLVLNDLELRLLSTNPSPNLSMISKEKEDILLFLQKYKSENTIFAPLTRPQILKFAINLDR